MKNKSISFWTDLESKKISKEQLTNFLFSKLGTPTNQIQTNLCQELVKKIHTYYFTEEATNHTTYSLTGTILKASDIIEKKFKEGKRTGQTYYVLKISTEEGTEQLQARQDDMPTEQWKQITKSAILGKNLVFKYRKWITNKQILDFHSQAKKGKVLAESKPKRSPTKAEMG